MSVSNLCGERIRFERKKQGLKQIDIVTAIFEEYKIKIDSTSLGRIERAERGVWDFELLAISKILNVSLEWLLEGKS